VPGFAAAAQPWHDLFTLAGGASGTLVGLLFVAATVGSGIFTRDRQAAFRAFVSSSVVHFACVLAAGLIGMVPTQSWLSGGLLVGGVGLFGLGYGALVMHSMRRHGIITKIGWDDRLLYGVVPVCGHLAIVASAVLLLLKNQAGFEVLTGAMVVLLFVGIRNAWDITAWSVLARADK
jgi:hypothetical protein